MTAARAIVIGETPSLGSAVTELLVADGVEASLVPDLAAAEALASAAGPAAPLVVIAAANGPQCETLRRWAASRLLRCDLVVVGRGDPSGPRGSRIHVVLLPMRPLELLVLVRTLLGLATSGGPEPSDGRVAIDRRSLLGAPVSGRGPRGLTARN